MFEKRESYAHLKQKRLKNVPVKYSMKILVLTSRFHCSSRPNNGHWRCIWCHIGDILICRCPESHSLRTETSLYLLVSLRGKLMDKSSRLFFIFWASLGGSVGKESACNVGDLDLIPRLGRSPGEGKGYTLQYSSLENSMDCIVHGSQRIGH